MTTPPDIHQSTFDTEGNPTVDVLQAVATVTDTDPLTAPPLAETIDPDALSPLVQGSQSVAVTFQYASCEICVESDGHIRVRHAPDEGRDS